MPDQVDKIKKQIHEQVDPSRKVGRVKVDRVTGYTFRDIKQTEKRGAESIDWKKRYYVWNRGGTNGLFDLDRDSFLAYSYTKTVRTINTSYGNLYDENLPQYVNTNYGLKIFSRTAKTIQLKIEANGGNASLYFGVDIKGTGTASGSVWTSDTDQGWTTDAFIGYKLYDNDFNEYAITANTSDTLTVTLGASGSLADGNFRIIDTGTCAEIASTEGDQIYGGGNYYLTMLANTWHIISFYYYSEASSSYVRILGDLGKVIDDWKPVDFEPPPMPTWNDTLVGTLSSNITTSSKHIDVSSAAAARAYGTVTISTLLPSAATADCVHYESKISTSLRYVTDIESSHSAGENVWSGSIITGYASYIMRSALIRLNWNESSVADLAGIGIYRVEWYDVGLTIYDQPTSTTFRFAGDIRTTLRSKDIIKIGEMERVVIWLTYDGTYTTVTLFTAFSGDITATIYKQQYTHIADVAKDERTYLMEGMKPGVIYEFALDAFDNSEFRNRSEKTYSRSIIAGDRTAPAKPTDIRYEISGGLILLWKFNKGSITDFAGFNIWAKGSVGTYVKDNSYFSTTSRFTVYSTNGLKIGDPILVQTASSWASGLITGIYANNIEVALTSTPAIGGILYQCISTKITSVEDSTTFTVFDATGFDTTKPLLLAFGTQEEETAGIWSISGDVITLRDNPNRMPRVNDRVINLELVANWGGEFEGLWSGNVTYRQQVRGDFGTINKYWISSYDIAGNQEKTKLNSTSDVYYNVGNIVDWGNNNLISSFDEVLPSVYPYADEVLRFVGEVFTNSDNEVVSPIAVVDMYVDDEYKNMAADFDVIMVKPLWWGTGTGSLRSYTTTTRCTPSTPAGNVDLDNTVIGGRLVDNNGDEFRITGRLGNTITLASGTPVSGDYGIISGAEDLG